MLVEVAPCEYTVVAAPHPAALPRLLAQGLLVAPDDTGALVVFGPPPADAADAVRATGRWPADPAVGRFLLRALRLRLDRAAAAAGLARLGPLLVAPQALVPSLTGLSGVVAVEPRLAFDQGVATEGGAPCVRIETFVSLKRLRPLAAADLEPGAPRIAVLAPITGAPATLLGPSRLCATQDARSALWADWTNVYGTAPPSLPALPHAVDLLLADRVIPVPTALVLIPMARPPVAALFRDGIARIEADLGVDFDTLDLLDDQTPDLARFSDPLLRRLRTNPVPLPANAQAHLVPVGKSEPPAPSPAPAAAHTPATTSTPSKAQPSPLIQAPATPVLSPPPAPTPAPPVAAPAPPPAAAPAPAKPAEYVPKSSMLRTNDLELDDVDDDVFGYFDDDPKPDPQPAAAPVPAPAATGMADTPTTPALAFSPGLTMGRTASTPGSFSPGSFVSNPKPYVCPPGYEPLLEGTPSNYSSARHAVAYTPAGSAYSATEEVRYSPYIQLEDSDECSPNTLLAEPASGAGAGDDSALGVIMAGGAAGGGQAANNDDAMSNDSGSMSGSETSEAMSRAPNAGLALAGPSWDLAALGGGSVPHGVLHRVFSLPKLPVTQAATLGLAILCALEGETRPSGPAGGASGTIPDTLPADAGNWAPLGEPDLWDTTQILVKLLGRRRHAQAQLAGWECLDGVDAHRELCAEPLGDLAEAVCDPLTLAAPALHAKRYQDDMAQLIGSALPVTPCATSDGAPIELARPELVVASAEGTKWCRVTSSVFGHWEKTELEPFAGSKNVRYGVVCDRDCLSFVRAFLSELSAVFQCCHLGSHSPVPGLTLTTTDGLRTALDRATVAPNTSVVVYVVTPSLGPHKPLGALVEQVPAGLDVVFEALPLSMAVAPTHTLLDLKEMAFHIYARCRPLSVEVPRLLPNLQVDQDKPTTLRYHLPAVTLRRTEGSDGQTVYGCYYVPPEAPSTVVVTWTDATGELLERVMVSEADPFWPSLAKTAWHRSLQRLMTVFTPCHIVLAKLGRVTAAEGPAWAEAIKGGSPDGFLASVAVVSMEPDRFHGGSGLGEATKGWFVPRAGGAAGVLVVAENLSLVIERVHQWGDSHAPGLEAIASALYALSWLNVSPRFPERYSALPVHAYVAQRMGLLASDR